ncbi:MAG: hypothetical protein LBE05_00925 [Microbacterium sp.]|jgi:ADP-ribosylglycohydrolase|nr:hypothetical protein [Microbacterium sp.]
MNYALDRAQRALTGPARGDAMGMPTQERARPDRARMPEAAASGDTDQAR